jgi:subtilisin-like proprotein convertase family protein
LELNECLFFKPPLLRPEFCSAPNTLRVTHAFTLHDNKLNLLKLGMTMRCVQRSQLPLKLTAFILFFTGFCSLYGQSGVCNRPELLQISAVSDSTALLTCTDVADDYDLEIRTIDQPLTGAPTHVFASNPPFLIENLTPGLRYRFSVRAHCSNGTNSEWAIPRTFSTDLNNARPCPLSFDLADTSCNSGGQIFKIHVDRAPGTALGNDIALIGVRLMIEHAWRSDLRVWLRAPDSVRVQLLGNMNAGDKNIGDPEGVPCPLPIELTEAPGALPLSVVAERDNFTGYYLPLQSFASFLNGQNPNGIWQLEICDAKLNDKGKLRVCELVFAQIGCAGIDSVHLTNVTENSARVAWHFDNSGDSVLVEYGPAGFSPGLGAEAGMNGVIAKQVQPVSNPFTINGLQALRPYDVYMRRQCAPGLWSANTPVKRFTPYCPITMIEQVDTLSPCPNGCADPCPLPGLWQNVTGDDYEWKVKTGPGLTYPNAGPPSAPEGTGNYLYFRNSCTPAGANGKKAVLRTSCVKVVAPLDAPCHFSFDLYMQTKLGQIGSLSLQISTNGGQTWTNLQTWSGNRGKRWRREFVSLAAYDGQTALFQFVANGAFGAYGDIAMDNLTFYGSLPDGAPNFIFYQDADHDGYGNTAQRIVGCNPETPPGYSALSGDCNDQNEEIYPGATEVPCNQTDENCNGMADDGYIPVPGIASVAPVCAGENVVLSATTNPVGTFYWFYEMNPTQALNSGNTLIINNIQTTSDFILLDSVAGGCAGVRATIKVTVNPNPDLALLDSVKICLGSVLKFGEIAITDASNTTGAYSYFAQFPLSVDNEISNGFITPGTSTTYFALKQTAAGCRDTLAIPISVLPIPSVQIGQADTLNVCPGQSLLLESVADDGLRPYIFEWNNHSSLPQLQVDAAETPGTIQSFSVRVTDANQCTGLDQVAVFTLPGITRTSILSVQDVSICGGSNGTIVLQPNDGVSPYRFDWSGPVDGTLTNVVNSGIITGLKQGGYRVTISDATGVCSMVMPQIILNAPGLSVSLDSILQPLCPEGATGEIRVHAQGQHPTFTWSNGAATATISDLPPGKYTVTITDGVCTQSLNDLEIIAPPPFEVLQVQQGDVECAGAQDGFIQLTMTGGTPPLSYSWSNGTLDKDVLWLSAGIYRAAVTDARGCLFITDDYLISEPLPLAVSLNEKSNLTCYGGKNGRLSVAVTGGVAPYHFKWSEQSETPAIEGLAVGTYTVTVTDTHSCSQIFSATITQPELLTTQNTYITQPTCIGALDGSIEVFMQGGQAPYHYRWSTSPEQDTLSFLNNRDAGFYSLTVSDAQGCTFTRHNIELIAPQLLSVTLDSLIPVSCFGGANGKIAVSIAGAMGNLSVFWNYVPGGLTISNMAAGKYGLYVSDERHCAIEAEYVVAQPSDSLLTTVLGVTNAMCAGEPNGSIDVDIQGGTPPYTIEWSNGKTTEDLPAAFAGIYSILVLDAHGCLDLKTKITVEEPPILNVTPTIHNIPCFGGGAGNIQLAVSGGIAPYHFQWSTDALTKDIFGLQAGAYTVTVLDHTGCAVILNDLEIQLEGAGFSIQNTQSYPVTCALAADGAVRITVSGGMPPYQFAWSPPVGLHPDVMVSTDQASELTSGIYQVTVTDSAGCKAVSESISVAEAPPLGIASSAIQPVACFGDSTGIIQIAPTGGLPPYTYMWGNLTNSFNVERLPAGSYELTLTDFASCTASFVFEVTEPDLPMDTKWQVDSSATGWQIKLEPSGGVAPYQVQWSEGIAQTGFVASGLFAGHYSATVTDAVSCSMVLAKLDVGTLGLDDQNPASKFLLFPNPTPGLAHIARGSNAPALLGYSLFDTFGRLIEVYPMNLGMKNEEFDIDLRQQPAGLYWVKFEFLQGRAQLIPIVRE